MPQPFSTKLEFVLKALSLTRGRLAAELGIDKSIVGRWARGAVKPSTDSLARLTALVAMRVEGFTTLDWERDLVSLARVLGVDPETAQGVQGRWFGDGPHTEVLDQILATTRRRGAAYEGFYRSTRPFASQPGRFVHDQMMIRKDEGGLLRFELACNGVRAQGWVLPQQNQLFVIGTENASGSLAFGIFNGVSAWQANVVDGLMLACALDTNRTPIAYAMVWERTGNLSGYPAEDDRRFAKLAEIEAMAPEGSVPEALAAHLTRDSGQAQLALGGDWLLSMPLLRSLSRGTLPP